VKPAPFDYARPESLEEAVQALAGHPEAKVLAGGQSLVPLLSMRLAAPAVLVDINGLPGLDHVRADSSGVRIGALARHAEVLADPEVARIQPLVTLALADVAHATIRNRGTTVGSLVHADAAAEMPMVLRLLQGSVDVVSPRGRRTIEAADLYVGPLESSLAHDEIAVEAFFPALPAGSGVAFEEIARRHGDYAMCGVAAVVAVEGDRVASARAGYLSVSDIPVVVDLTDAFAGFETLAPLAPQPPASGVDAGSLAAAADVALAELAPEGDIHATAEYRTHLVRVLTARVLAAAYQDARARTKEKL
jgi:carbon-monoxide dehydrogenase medium subunit